VPKRPSALADLLDGEPVFAQHHFSWRRGAETLDAEHARLEVDLEGSWEDAGGHFTVGTALEIDALLAAGTERADVRASLTSAQR